MNSSTPLLETKMREGLKLLDELLHAQVTLIIGGGGALLLAHGIPLSTHDIDAIPKGLSVEELDPYIKKVATRLNLPTDWLNPYFASFTHTLPRDYGSRLIEVYKGQRLTVLSLSSTDLLIMKCFAHRLKDVSHARALIKRGADVDQTEHHIEALKAKRITGAQAALDFLHELLEDLEA